MKLFNTVLIGIAFYALCGCNERSSADKQAEGYVVPPQSVNADEIPPGKQIFEEKCSACHGSDGAAGIGNAANLQTSKLDSTSIIQQISNGKKSMPSFKTQLTITQITELENYVTGLRK